MTNSAFEVLTRKPRRKSPLEILTRKLVQLSVPWPKLTAHAKTRGIRALFLDNDGLDSYYHHPRKIKTNRNYDGKTKETKVVYSYFVIALLNDRDYLCLIIFPAPPLAKFVVRSGALRSARKDR